MKKILSLILFSVLVLMVNNVKADAGPPMVVEYDVIVTNKDGAYCYETNDGKYVKTSKKVPYGSVYNVWIDTDGAYVVIESEDCYYLKASDVAAKNDSLSVNSNGVEKITPVKAVILAKGGLNLRKGPAVAYSRITTIPQYTVVTLKYKAGDYWYYAEYNGKKGWITGINSYLGYDYDYILYSNEDVKIYDYTNKTKVIGTIPALTEITNYIKTVYYHSDSSYDEFDYYVNYNGIKGLVNWMPYKASGEVKLNKDAKLYDKKGKVIETIKKGTTLSYSIMTGGEQASDTTFYIPSKNGFLVLNNMEERKNSNGEMEYVDVENYVLVKDPVYLKKTSGFIGSGLFGEKNTSGSQTNTNNNTNTEQEEPNNNVNNNSNNNENNNENNGVNNQTNNQGNNNNVPKDNKLEIIIIGVLSGIIVALTSFILMKYLNEKKSNNVKVEEKKLVEEKTQEVKVEQKVEENNLEEKKVEEQSEEKKTL